MGDDLKNRILSLNHKIAEVMYASTQKRKKYIFSDIPRKIMRIIRESPGVAKK